MIRLVLFAAFVAIVTFTVAAILRSEREMAQTGQGSENRMISPRFSRITYILLLILLFGVTSGLLGAA
ncbi:hypothetical protein [Yoonia litorea]|uniref:Uncharacterized protein n=1 Tax=Yoonia litorea TaxID=1123755 RepID=A0A1I6LGN3_9RHOB|nr:hypothetical protein [Yoonia litorea]SFS02685.1 hypothetical protein SAMN05444714_0534 [Yoonia litorea]